MKNLKSAQKAAALAAVISVLTAGAAVAETILTTSTVNAIGSIENRLGNVFKECVADAGTDLSINHVEGTVLGNAPQVMD